MIIQSLYNYYNLLHGDPDFEEKIPKPGYRIAKVSLVMTISKNGDLLDLTPISDDKSYIYLIVPYQKDRTRNVLPHFLCDKTDYILGWKLNSKKPVKKQDYFIKCVEVHNEILKNTNNDKAKAILNFFDNWDIDGCLEHKVINTKMELLKKMKTGMIVFKLDGETGLIHDDEEIRTIWETHEKNTSDEKWVSQCLATGKQDLIIQSHPTVTGVKGAQKAGARLISVDKQSSAFESYQKTQCYNSPVGGSVVFGYTTILDYMLRTQKHNMIIGDTTMVFWAEDFEGKQVDLMSQLLNPGTSNKKTNNGARHDSAITDYVKDTLQCLREGRKPIHEKDDVNFYILGLSPNNARVAVRFWYADHFGRLVQTVWQHQKDMELVDVKREIIPVYEILNETIPSKARNKEVAPLLGGALIKSIFTGRSYPVALYYAMINRIRADYDIKPLQVRVIKAFLKRKARLQKDDTMEGMITVSLNEENPNIAYRLGRLFAVLERAQKEAADGELKSTITNKYFGTASASPRSVFPLLIRLSRHHISKSNYGHFRDLEIQEILHDVDDFPRYLDLEEQGMFILGYYHQKKAPYQKRNIENEEVSTND